MKKKVTKQAEIKKKKKIPKNPSSFVKIYLCCDMNLFGFWDAGLETVLVIN